MSAPALPLNGRRALVTDGAGTIGRAIAAVLAGHGAMVATDAGVDLADARAVELLAGTAEPVDILVHVACPQHISPVERFPPAEWDRILAVGLTAAFHLTRLLLPGMRARAWGRIIHMSSVQGLVASVDKSAYVAAKHGLIGFTKAVALETAGSGITCNAFCPGWLGIDGTRAQAAAFGAKWDLPPDQALQRMLAEKQPSGQWVPLEALGALVAFLCGDAAAQITGTAIPIDGGWVAQ